MVNDLSLIDYLKAKRLAVSHHVFGTQSQVGSLNNGIASTESVYAIMRNNCRLPLRTLWTSWSRN
jgi:hypothetical protein